MKLILASASPRRAELLRQAGLDFTILAAHIDETPLPDEAAASYVQRLATEKAQAICRQLTASPTPEPTLILAADTTVVCDGEILNKPTSPEDARRILTLLSGRTHAVLTGIAALATTPGARTVADVEITQVTVNLIPPTEIDAYIATGEPLDKAGAYAIQGRAARWIPRIEGDYFNVVGLPIARTLTLLEEAQQPPDPTSTPG